MLAAGSGLPYCSAMAFLDTKRDRAAFLIFVLGLGLVYALWPFSTGLIGAPGALHHVRPHLPVARRPGIKAWSGCRIGGVCWESC